MTQIVRVEDLDGLMSHFDEAAKISSDKAYSEFSKYSVAHPENLPSDPFSEEYYKVYMDLYNKISQRDHYDVQNENVDFDIEQGVLRPFPYYSKSLRLAGQHYSLIGGLLGFLGDLKDGSDILECGFGWGNTTLAFAMLGHNVTALDINEKYCEVVRRRAELVQAKVNLVHADFLWMETTGQTFDAIVFFESFHHCREFERLVKAMHRVLRPGGVILFGAEPINAEFPVPWGVRLDGESLRVARAFGWLELGFNSDFFVEMMHRYGWWTSNLAQNFWIARSSKVPMVIPGDDPRLKSMIGQQANGVLKVATPGAQSDRFYALFGPYVALARGRYRVDIEIENRAYRPGKMILDVAHSQGAVRPAVQEIGSDALMRQKTFSMEFEMDRHATDVEFRIEVPGGGLEFSIKSVTLVDLDNQG
jgi:2-polyprenyl-3-methyl-5-hydroxy-6-metoxy-1,4-benzoquinol methylase